MKNFLFSSGWFFLYDLFIRITKNANRSAITEIHGISGELSVSFSTGIEVESVISPPPFATVVPNSASLFCGIGIPLATPPIV